MSHRAFADAITCWYTIRDHKKDNVANMRILTIYFQPPVLGLGLGLDFTFTWDNNENNDNNPHLNFLKGTK